MIYIAKVGFYACDECYFNHNRKCYFRKPRDKPGGLKSLKQLNLIAIQEYLAFILKLL